MKKGVDFIGVGVGAVIVDGDGRLLLALRGPKARNQPGRWEFPGGAVEFNEQHRVALRREIKEELGIEIEVGDLIDIVDDIIPDEGQHWISPGYVCRIVSGQPHIQPGEEEKIARIGWFHPADVPDNLTGASRHTLEAYLRKRP